MSGNLNRHTISKDPQNKKGAEDKFLCLGVEA